MFEFLSSEKIRFIISGLLVNGISFLIYLVMIKWFLSPKEALSLLYWVAVIYIFFINRKFVFKYNNQFLYSFIKFLGVYILGYFISISLMTLALDYFLWNEVLSMILASLIMPVYFYVMQKYLVFK
jgi:putative flippase GtrA